MTNSDNNCDDNKKIHQNETKSIETNHEIEKIVNRKNFIATFVIKLLKHELKNFFCVNDDIFFLQSNHSKNRLIEIFDRETFDRINRTRILCSMFVYKIVLSKNDQQRVFDWFRYSTKQTFDKKYVKLFVQWKKFFFQHENNCVFSFSIRQSNFLIFRAIDHNIFFVRILIWFHDKIWFKKNVKLNNFFDCDLYQFMKIFHLCHHNRCLIHVIYEFTNNMKNRKICFQSTKYLRCQILNIFDRCNQHDSFCLLQINNSNMLLIEISFIWQHVVLIFVKTYFIQLDIFFRARYFEFESFFDKFAFHSYFIFETQLFLCWKIFEFVINVNSNHLIHEFSNFVIAKKFALLCKFCRESNRFAIIFELWNHIVHEHQNVDVQRRLKKIKQTTSFWQFYWKYLIQNRKNFTINMLTQIRFDEFCWKNVIAWKLR